MNPNNTVKSRYTVRYHEGIEKVAIVDKETDEVIESFSDNISEYLLIQRMSEIREDEILRHKLIQGTSLDENRGIIIPGQEEFTEASSNIILP